MKENVKRNSDELNELITNAMEIADIITLQEILEKNNIKYDKKIEKMKDLKDSVSKKCSDEKMETILKEFDEYKAQATDIIKRLDVNNLEKFEAEQVIKAIGRTASPIAQTLIKSALTIAIYQGMYIMPVPIKVGIAGSFFMTKRIPKMYKGAKNGLEKLKNGGIRKVPKKVLATVIAGGIGAEAIVLLNYLANGSIPTKILNALPGIKNCLKMVPSLNARKTILLTTGVVKGVDAYRLKNKENKMFEPIIKGFFLAKGIKIEEEIDGFSDIKKYVENLDDQSKYEFDQYLKKCVSMKKMINSKDDKISKVGNGVLKLVSDSFEMASYLALVTPMTIGGENKENNNVDGEKSPEPATVTSPENATSKIPQAQAEVIGETEPIQRTIEAPEENITMSSKYQNISEQTERIIAPPNETLPDVDKPVSQISNQTATITRNETLPDTHEAKVQVTEVPVILNETTPKMEYQPEMEYNIETEKMVDVSKTFIKASPSKWNRFLDSCEEHAGEIVATGATIAAVAKIAYKYFMESGLWGTLQMVL